MRVDLGLLGPFRVVARGSERLIPARKHRVLVAELALRGRRSRGELVALLWPDSDDERGRESLRHALYRVRATLGDDVFDARGEDLALAAHVRVDVRDFERLVASRDRSDLERAIELYRGPLCAELDETDAEAERARLSALAANAAERVANELLDDDPVRAVAVARRAVEIDPYLEAGHRVLLRGLAKGGDIAAAAAHYRRLVAMLRSELGVAPSPQTQAVFASLDRAATSTGRVVRPSLEPPARLVGRREQYEAGMSVVIDAIDGRGGAALLVGEAGAGKTRLLDEIAGVCEQHGIRVIRSRAMSSEGRLAYQLWVDALRDAEHDAAALPHPWPSILSALLPGVAVADPPASATPELQRTRLFEAVVRVLARLAERGPVLLLLDDLHHADDDSVHLLHYVCRVAGAHRLAVIGAARPAHGPPLHDAVRSLQARSHLRAIELQPLGAQAVTELLANAGVRRADLAWLAPRVARWTGGNPHYALEAVRALAAQGRLTRVGDEWTWAAAVPSESEPLAPELPADVRATVLSRVATLPVATRRVLELASTLGTRLRIDVLAGVAGRDALGLVEDLAPAFDAALLRGPGDRGDTVEFAHELIRDALYQHAPPIARVAIHRRVAETLERLGAAHSVIAAHLVAAGDAAAAIDHWLAAAREAAVRHAHEESARASRQALAALGPMSPRRPAILSVVGDAEMRRGDVRAAVAAYDDALGALEEGAAAERAALATKIARAAKWYVRHPRALELAEDALAMARRTGGSSLADALIALAWVRLFDGAANEAIVAGDEARRIAREADDARLEAEAHQVLVRARWLRGEALATVARDDLDRLSSRLGDDEGTCALYEVAVPGLVRRGDGALALPLAERGLDVARRVGSLRAVLKAGEDVVDVLLALARYADAARVAEQVRREVAPLDLAEPPSLVGTLVNALAFGDDAARARELARELLDAARARRDRPAHSDFALATVNALMAIGDLPPRDLIASLRPSCRTCDREWLFVAGRVAALGGELDEALRLADELAHALEAEAAPRLATGPSHIRALIATVDGRVTDAARERVEVERGLAEASHALGRDRFERDLALARLRV